MKAHEHATANACEHCAGPVGVRVVPEYRDAPLGIDGVVLDHAVIERKCEHCGEVADVIIPDVPGLIAAIAVARVMRERKLNGRDIKFLRKAIELPARDLATKLGVRPETLSRWETGAEAISLPTEKLLRLMVGEKVHGKAPGVEFDLDYILGMDVRSVRAADDDDELRFFRGPERKAQRRRPSKERGPSKEHVRARVQQWQRKAA